VPGFLGLSVLEVEMNNRIPLTRGKYAIIDDRDCGLAKFNWFASSRGYGDDEWTYAARDVLGKRIYLHRVILERKLGHAIKPGFVVDHIDRNPLNNRRSNLRMATHRQNSANSRRTQKKTRRLVSPYRGVYWIIEKKLWRAQISANKKSQFLGYFKSSTKAARAYDRAATKEHGQFATLNFP
jgi:hypothetical protein